MVKHTQGQVALGKMPGFRLWYRDHDLSIFARVRT